MTIATNGDDGSYFPQEYLHLVGKWRHVDVYIRSRVFNIRSPLKKILGLECRNVGLSMQSCVAIVFIKTKTKVAVKYLDLIPVCDIVINFISIFMLVHQDVLSHRRNILSTALTKREHPSSLT